MNDYLKLKLSNCKNCYKCIRNCPVKSISFSNNQAHIVENECVLCGQCFVACPQNAKEIRNDVPTAKRLIKENEIVIASLAPSFVANYAAADITEMEKVLKKLGFYCAAETAIGATVVKKNYDRLLHEKNHDLIISSCCHTINMLIQKYYPGVLPYLADIISPMQAHCMAIKNEYPAAKTVFIGPCISKKAEAEQYPEYVDCVLTFEELTQWFKDENIEIEKSSEHSEGGKARLFPTAGGILKSMECDCGDYDYISVDGMDNCIAALKDIDSGNISKCFVEMSACSGSCIGGPAMERTHHSPVKDYITVNGFAGQGDFDVKLPDNARLKKHIPFVGVDRQMPGSAAIEEILHSMGKTKPEHELNCGTCGYNTCREKAIAVYQGKANLSMCLPFLKEKAESFSDNIIKNSPNGIVVINESLEVQQINASAQKIMNIRSAGDVLGEQVVRILDPQPFFEVINSGRTIHNRRCYLAEYRRYIDQTIIHDKSYRILICIMRDVTEEEVERDKKEKISRQTIEITDKVVEKQMRVVQEIASLLGETTAETKIALTNLKESLRDE